MAETHPRQLSDLGSAVDQNRPAPKHPLDERADRCRAVYRITGAARDADDAALLLDALGLDPDRDTA